MDTSCSGNSMPAGNLKRGGLVVSGLSGLVGGGVSGRAGWGAGCRVA